MSSSIYNLLARAMKARKQIVCVYDGYPRALCPIILGHTRGEEVALCFQFSGGSRSGLPRGGQWKCLRLAKMQKGQLRDGRWYAGPKHRQAQSCVEVVEFDVNPASPYQPKQRS